MQLHQLRMPAWMDPGRPGFLLSLLGGLFNAGLDILLDSSRTLGRSAQPCQGLSQGQSCTVDIAPLVPSGQCWVWGAAGWIQALPSAVWCLYPLRWEALEPHVPYGLRVALSQVSLDSDQSKCGH